MKSPFPLFARFGVELEYMIVDERSLNIRPWADRLIRQVAGDVDGEVRRGQLAWSNELALHVIEFKTARPAPALDHLASRFQREVQAVNTLLAAEGARLLPTAMHPWMNPGRESRLWPHECGPIYQTFHRIFDCRGHGWTNLQSTHLNLPFANEEEFERLHTAIRLVLPLLPALAASSPFVEGRRGPMLDMRLDAYRRNCARIPSITASVVPEWIPSPQAYDEQILQRIYRDLAPHDPEGTLRHEWANARGAIARFERHTIEIRVLDIQECPAADLAILQFVTALLRDLVEGQSADPRAQRRPSTTDLSRLLRLTTRSAGRAQVTSRELLSGLGIEPRTRWNVRDLCLHLLDRVAPRGEPWRPWIERILQQGTLAERIVQAAGNEPSRHRLRSVYRRLAECLDQGQAFETETGTGIRRTHHGPSAQPAAPVSCARPRDARGPSADRRRPAD